MRLIVHLAAGDPAGVRARADAGGHLEREALAELVAPRAAVRSQLGRWFAAAGLSAMCAGLGDSQWSAEVDRAALARLLGAEAAGRLQARRQLSDAAARAALPGALGPAIDPVVALELAPSGEVPAPRALLAPETCEPPKPGAGLAPADIMSGYGFDGRDDGDGETVAMLALGGVPSAADVHGFARAFGLPAPRVELRPVTPLGACADDPLCRFETTMGVQWLTALAPGARVVVYLVDPRAVADPWATFLMAVLSDMSRRPTIAVTSWSAPARQYYAVHGREPIAGLLDQAAAAGISVIAASGDWGAYDGFPSAGPGRDACDALTPRDTFPGAEPRVLSVGGTHVRGAAPWREVAWSAPVSPALRAMIGLGTLAGSGGVSPHHPVPEYQRPLLPPSFARSGGASPIAATGRVQPDVALMAWGPDAGAEPAAYACLLDGVFRGDAGGTSVAAPIWAAVIARINQARRRAGLPRLGWAQPHLYAAWARDRACFRDVCEGATDIDLPVLDADVRAWRRLPGFVAGPGLDPATGLGVPRVGRLVDALTASTLT